MSGLYHTLNFIQKLSESIFFALNNKKKTLLHV